jgi:hypothetical protein
MPLYFKRALKQIAEILQPGLQRRRHPQSGKMKIPLHRSQPNGVIQKGPQKIMFSDLLAQMEQELQALNQLIRS